MTKTEPASPAAHGTRELRRRASERIGEWVRKKWRIDALIGVGGMASVFAATHRNGSRAALKILHVEFAHEEPIKRRFLREGYVANKVNHPGRVAILDDDETDGGEPFLVMELLEGRTVQQFWKRGKGQVDPAEALRIAASVLDTLVPFHELNIVHRDLKPANIFICHDGEVKLLDFGVAQLREQGDDHTRAGTALGTPSYMSPEQAMGKTDELDGRSDVYSVGATLYAILSGQRLHQGKSENEAFILAATQPAPSLARTAPDVPLDVVALVDKSLQWNRNKRFANSAEMRDACHVVMQRLNGASASPSNDPVSHGAPPVTRQGFELKESAPPRSQPTRRPPEPASAGAAPIATSDRPTSGTQTQHGGLAAGVATAVDDKTLDALRSFFERLGRLSPTIRQYGFEHPESSERVTALYRAFSDAMETVEGPVSWEIHPFCFTYKSVAVWEPEPPADVFAYRLASGGLTELTVASGIGREEFGAFMQILLEGGGGDSDHDVSAALWEANLTHISYELRNELTDADAAEQARFHAEMAELEELAANDGTEVAAAAAIAEQGTQSVSDHQIFEPAVLRALSTQLEQAQSNEQSLTLSDATRRFNAVLAEAWGDVVQRDDPQSLQKSFSKHARAIVSRGRVVEYLDAYDALGKEVANLKNHDAKKGATSALVFSGRVLSGAIGAIDGSDPAIISVPEELRADATKRLKAILEELDPRLAPALLRRANTLAPGPLRHIVLRYLERGVAPRGKQLAAALPKLEPWLAHRLVAALAKHLEGTARAEWLDGLAASPLASLRCEAWVYQTAPDRSAAAEKIAPLLKHADPKTRSAALDAIRAHRVRPAARHLVNRVQSEAFAELLAPEQHDVFDCLHELYTSRADALLAELVAEHGLLADAALDQRRTQAAIVLGSRSEASSVLHALEGATRRRPWNSVELREAAENAMTMIKTRLAGPQTGVST